MQRDTRGLLELYLNIFRDGPESGHSLTELSTYANFEYLPVGRRPTPARNAPHAAPRQNLEPRLASRPDAHTAPASASLKLLGPRCRLRNWGGPWA